MKFFNHNKIFVFFNIFIIILKKINFNWFFSLYNFKNFNFLIFNFLDLNNYNIIINFNKFNQIPFVLKSIKGILNLFYTNSYNIKIKLVFFFYD